MLLRKVHPLVAFIMLTINYTSAPAFAQDTSFKVSVQVSSRTSAAEIGLPVYPGATITKDGESSSDNIGILLNDRHLGVRTMTFVTADSAERVLEYYRKPLA
ncbi:hypothetical protein [Granulicella mallensis]|uniref:Uncharacterized protein n=1 Tax=Granulicella mallensis TaxID=940614 RepID=A0A7W7ZN40_9BACT|nr:hypothetical protein [Granulicella mallensis]MBB5062652.1 hypothetical protein [Granulicella mallensis]